MGQITCQFCGDTFPDFDVAHVCSRGQYAHGLLNVNKMNEHVKELMVKAGYAAPELASRAKLLSELMIRECAEFSRHDPQSVNAMFKYFGVE